MSVNLKIQGNFFSLSRLSDGGDLMRLPLDRVTYFVSPADERRGNYITFTSPQNPEAERVHLELSEIRDDRTGSIFTSLSDLESLLNSKLGRAESTVVSNTPKLVMVTSENDFPNAVSGARTLEDNVTYFIASNVDLKGDRLISGSNTTIIGGSSENCTLTSSGLAIGTPLLTIEYTTPIRNISFKDVDTAIRVNGRARIVALDWTGVNFVNVPNIGTIESCDNFIFTKGAFLNSGGISFTGTIGTVAFNQSLFDSDASNTIFDLESGLTIERRFRIIYSSLIVLSGEGAIRIDGAATIPTEGVILDTCNFSGNGTYLRGIDFQDNKALFVNNVGITNSRAVAQYFMNGNATATVVSSSGVAYKAAGTTTNGAITSKFFHSNNRQTYTGDISKAFTITATLSVESGNNNQIGVYIAKNGVILNDSEVYITTNSTGRAEGAAVQTVTDILNGDYIEIFVENDTTSNNITVTDLNVIIQ